MRREDQRGFTLIEVSILLLALAIIGGILVPSIGNMNALARKVRIKEDLQVLCVSLKMMLDDMGDSAFFSAGQAHRVSAASSSSFGASSSFSSSAFQSGASRVRSQTEYGVAVQRARGERVGARDQVCQGGDCGPADEWCVNCDMPHADCTEDCMDDCNEHCSRPRRQQRYASVTTQTTDYAAGSSAIGRTSSFATSSSSSFVSGGAARGRFFGAPIGLLVGDGDIPASAIGATEWQLQVGSVFSAVTHGIHPTSIQFVVDTFGNQLIHRDPRLDAHGFVRAGAGGFGAVGVRGAGVGVAGTGLAGFGGGFHHFQWRGPYIADRIDPDPWGNRYMANVFALHVPPAGVVPATHGVSGHVESFQTAVVCYSAGPNETIETFFNQPFGWVTGGDDVTVVLAGAGGIR